MLTYSLFSSTLERNQILNILVTIATIALLSSTFLCPPKNGWTGLFVNGLSLQRIRYNGQYR